MPDYLIRQLFITLCVYMGMMLVGYGMGWSAPIIIKLQDPEQTPLPEPITDGQASWVASVLYIGTIIGPHVSGYLSNKQGRKPALFLGGFLTATAFLLLATAVNFAMIIAGRILIGLGTGIIFVVSLVYLGEIASTNIRGMLLTGTGIFSTLGTLVVFSTAPYISYSVTSYLAVGISLVYIVGIFFIPETPSYLALKGKEKEAKDTLVFLGRHDEITKELDTQTKKQLTVTANFKDLFTIRENKKALFITITLCILQQMSGVVVVLFFATTIFELAGSTIPPNIATIIIGVTQLVSSVISSGFVEKVGRKVLLLWSTAACFVSLAILGVYFYLDHIGIEVEIIGWLPLVCLVIFFLSYDMGFGIIPSTFTGEMYHDNVCSTGSAITITVGWLFGFGLSTAFGYMLSAIGGHFTFWIFAGACAFAFVFTVIFVPETKGKTLVQIQEMLSR